MTSSPPKRKEAKKHSKKSTYAMPASAIRALADELRLPDGTTSEAKKAILIVGPESHAIAEQLNTMFPDRSFYSESVSTNNGKFPTALTDNPVTFQVVICNTIWGKDRNDSVSIDGKQNIGSWMSEQRLLSNGPLSSRPRVIFVTDEICKKASIASVEKSKVPYRVRDRPGGVINSSCDGVVLVVLVPFATTDGAAAAAAGIAPK